jgi:hypothetical protein
MNENIKGIWRVSIMRYYYDKTDEGSEPIEVYDDLDELIDTFEEYGTPLRDAIDSLRFGNCLEGVWISDSLYLNGYGNYDIFEVEDYHIESDTTDYELFWREYKDRVEDCVALLDNECMKFGNPIAIVEDGKVIVKDYYNVKDIDNIEYLNLVNEHKGIDVLLFELIWNHNGNIKKYKEVFWREYNESENQ